MLELDPAEYFYGLVNLVTSWEKWSKSQTNQAGSDGEGQDKFDEKKNDCRRSTIVVSVVILVVAYIASLGVGYFALISNDSGD